MHFICNYESPQTSMDLHGGPWRSMKVREGLWRYMKIRFFEEFRKFPYVIINLCRSPRISMEIHEGSWRSVEIYRNLRFYILFLQKKFWNKLCWKYHINTMNTIIKNLGEHLSWRSNILSRSTLKFHKNASLSLTSHYLSFSVYNIIDFYQPPQINMHFGGPWLA